MRVPGCSDKGSRDRMATFDLRLPMKYTESNKRGSSFFELNEDDKGNENERERKLMNSKMFQIS